MELKLFGKKFLEIVSFRKFRNDRRFLFHSLCLVGNCGLKSLGRELHMKISRWRHSNCWFVRIERTLFLVEWKMARILVMTRTAVALKVTK